MSNANAGDLPSANPCYAAALARLPDAYASVLRLAESTATADEICARLGIEPESFGLLLEVAYRKLHTELSQSAQLDPESPE